MNLSQAYRQFGGAQRKYKGEEGTAKMWGEGTKMIGDAMQFIGEAAAPQVEDWQDFEAGQKAVGVTDENIQGPANLWQKMTKSPTDIMSGAVTSGDMSYDVSSLQMLGTIKSQRDSLGAAAIQASAGGKSLEEIYGKKIGGTDSPSELSRKPSMWEKALSKFKGGDKVEKDDGGMSFKDEVPSVTSEPVKEIVPAPVVEVKRDVAIEEPSVVEPKLENDNIGTTADENDKATKQAREKGLLKPGQMLWEMEGFKALGKSRSKRLEYFKNLGIAI